MTNDPNFDRADVTENLRWVVKSKYMDGYTEQWLEPYDPTEPGVYPPDVQRAIDLVERSKFIDG